MAKTGPRKKLPRKLAVIHVDRCTGCEACVEVCPVDCIELITRRGGVKGAESWCEIDWERCVGCELCIRLPRKKSDPYELLVCPWEAIEMTPLERLLEAAVQLGGPPDYAAANRDRLARTARRLVQLQAGV